MRSLIFRAGLAGFALAAVLPWRDARGQVFADFQTNMGGFTIELFHEDVPRTVANFVSLAEGTRPWLDPRTQQVRVSAPYYDGISFHRVIPNFMIQGGSPAGTGSDGPGYKFPDELTKSPTGQLRHTHNAAGMLSMANAGVHTNGSQFFLTTSVTAPATFPTHLDDKHTVLGKIAAGPGGTAAQGQAVIDAISAVPRNLSDKPVTAVVIQTVRIRRVGASATAFDALAWALPDVTGVRTITSAVYNSGATPPTTTRFELTYDRPRYQATAFNYSFDAATWQLLALGTAQATSIATSSGNDPLTINGVGSFPILMVRGRSLDYTALIERTKPALTESAELRLLFTTPPGIEVTARRTGATTGTWSVPGPPAATGGVSPLTYDFGTGDPGLFSPLLAMSFPTNRLPWTTGVGLSSLNVTLTFDANSTTTGYFTSSGINAATSATVTGKGVFAVTAP